jgi:hypothetical protein
MFSGLQPSSTSSEWVLFLKKKIPLALDLFTTPCRVFSSLNMESVVLGLVIPNQLLHATPMIVECKLFPLVDFSNFLSTRVAQGRVA